MLGGLLEVTKAPQKVGIFDCDRSYKALWKLWLLGSCTRQGPKHEGAVVPQIGSLQSSFDDVQDHVGRWSAVGIREYVLPRKHESSTAGALAQRELGCDL